MYSVSVLRSIFDVRGSGEAIPLVDLSEPLSGMGGDPRLISVTAREDGPGNARELIGERDCQHVAMKPPRGLLDPGPQTLPCLRGRHFPVIQS